MILDKLASSIYNDVMSGLRGYHTNISLSIDLLKSDIIDTRLQIIKEYQMKGILPRKDLMLSINCINVDCKDIEKCRCTKAVSSTPLAHFEIPQIVNDFGIDAIDYIGSTDKKLPFLIYTSMKLWENHKYRKRGKHKPIVYIDITPNENGMLDCFVFNAPLLKLISVVAIFKDPSLLENYSCCDFNSDDNFSFINQEIKNRLTKQKLYYYRLVQASVKPNNQMYE